MRAASRIPNDAKADDMASAPLGAYESEVTVMISVKLKKAKAPVPVNLSLMISSILLGSPVARAIHASPASMSPSR